MRAAHGTRADVPLLVTVARFHPQKGLDTLLDALPAVVARVPGVRPLIVGEGPLDAQLRSQADRLGLTDCIVWAPPGHPADELGAADVVAIPSLWESGPLVLTEALALGRPVVATSVGIVRELIDDGVSGWIVPVGDPAAAGRRVGRCPARSGRGGGPGRARPAGGRGSRGGQGPRRPHRVRLPGGRSDHAGAVRLLLGVVAGFFAARLLWLLLVPVMAHPAFHRLNHRSRVVPTGAGIVIALATVFGEAIRLASGAGGVGDLDDERRPTRGCHRRRRLRVARSHRRHRGGRRRAACAATSACSSRTASSPPAG